MFAAWRCEENGLNDWMERKLGTNVSRFVRPVVVTALEIVTAPIELAERIFYRPNRRRDALVAEDLQAKSKNLLTQTYLDTCTQTIYGDKHLGIKFDPKRTYDRLEACTSGTFKALASDAPQSEQSHWNLPAIPETHRAPNSLSISRMTDSQIISGRPRTLLVRPFRGELAENEFAATASGTFVPLAGFHKWQRETVIPKKLPDDTSKSGTYPTVPAGENPHGLERFIQTTENERIY